MITTADAQAAGFGPCAVINLQALRHNQAVARRLAPGARHVAVIKADAYGHGMLQVAAALDQVDMLAVARVSEGVKLRDAGIKTPVLVLEGFCGNIEIDQAIAAQLQLVIHHQSQLELLEQRRDLAAGSVRFWLKLDTGMHRLGIGLERVAEIHSRLMRLSCRRGQPVLMTHFANADDIQHPATAAQLQSFEQVTSVLDGEHSLANSAAVLAWPETHRDWVRPGIMLYGASPLPGVTGQQHQLRPVMTLKSRLMAINPLKAGDCIGYGSTWCCPQDMLVGVVAIGYGDGYPRHARSGTPVLVNGQRSQLVGRVSMDMITVDLRNIQAGIGDEVILWGEGLPAEEVADAADTISYELFCGVTARVGYHYRDQEDDNGQKQQD